MVQLEECQTWWKNAQIPQDITINTHELNTV